MANALSPDSQNIDNTMFGDYVVEESQMTERPLHRLDELAKFWGFEKSDRPSTRPLSIIAPEIGRQLVVSDSRIDPEFTGDTQQGLTENSVRETHHGRRVTQPPFRLTSTLDSQFQLPLNRNQATNGETIRAEAEQLPQASVRPKCHLNVYNLKSKTELKAKIKTNWIGLSKVKG